MTGLNAIIVFLIGAALIIADFEIKEGRRKKKDEKIQDPARKRYAGRHISNDV